jgi:hypothetical protein
MSRGRVEGSRSVLEPYILSASRDSLERMGILFLAFEITKALRMRPVKLRYQFLIMVNDLELDKNKSSLDTCVPHLSCLHSVPTSGSEALLRLHVYIRLRIKSSDDVCRR